MGRNLALNFREKGILVFGFDPDDVVRARFISSGAGLVCSNLGELVNKIQPPRVICLLVPADKTQTVVKNLVQILSPGDVIVDAGNSYFKDTERLQVEALCFEIGLLGMGISGGEAGARHGPAIMVSGASRTIQLIQPVFSAIAAKCSDGKVCFTSVGPGGSGHFVKTLHNGIEYADMQLLAEAAFILRVLYRKDVKDVAKVFRLWQEGPLASYLLEAAIAVLDADDDDGTPLIERISDVADQNRTGQWAVMSALELGVPAPCIAEAVFARTLSTWRSGKIDLHLHSVRASAPLTEKVLSDLHDAVRTARIVAFTQGFAVIAKASQTYRWSINLSEVAEGWRSGCIIRGSILDDLVSAYRSEPDPDKIPFNIALVEQVSQNHLGLRRTVECSVAHAVPIPMLASSMCWLDALVQERLWTDLIQGQRDYFGGHGFERVNRQGIYHHSWDGT
jgi:6-phosphogluconate dehydrogenase